MGSYFSKEGICSLIVAFVRPGLNRFHASCRGGPGILGNDKPGSIHVLNGTCKGGRV